MRLVVIESPYGSNPDGSRASAETIERNVKYLRACMADCLKRDEAPIASHALYTQPGVLDDSKKEEREKGMHAGWAWHCVVEAVVVYVDLGMTDGMIRGIEHAFASKYQCYNCEHQCKPKVEFRKLGPEWR